MANLFSLFAACFGWESSNYGNIHLLGPRPPPPPKPTNTASVCVMEALRGSHHFKIAGYSLGKDMPRGEFLSSDTFSVGGHNWVIRYYPSSFNARSEGHIGFTVVLKSDASHVKASFECLIRCRNGATFARIKSDPKVYDHYGHSFGCSEFVEKIKLEEASDCIVDDCLTIVCNVSVIRQRPKEGEQNCPIVVPLSDYHCNFGKMLETGLGADVTFNVGGKKFVAHRCVLAAQSLVFQNVLYGPMREKDECITIEGMESVVFGALLYFVYNDSLPEMEGSVIVMAQHLFEAADLYGLQRLKLICERQLYEGMHVDSVVSTLILADQHQCVDLKGACLDFIVGGGKLDEIMETDGYKHLLATGHPVLNELIRKLGSGCPNKVGSH